MYTTVIIDDERKAREALEKIIDRYFSNKYVVVASAESVKAGVEAIKKYNPDIVFLDIEMPEENGFELFKHFPSIPFDVIFTTAYQKYAVKAIKCAALDYLLKPVNQIDLKEAFTRFESNYLKKAQQERINLLLNNVGIGCTVNDKIAFASLTGYEMVNLRDIIYCEADHNYTVLHIASGTTLTVSKTLKSVEELLPEDLFFRVHKKYLVNLNYIKKYSRIHGHKIMMENGDMLDVATRRTDEFIKVITAHKR